MNPARLKHPIKIQEERVFKDPDTKITKREWITIRECRAEFNQPRGKNYYQAAVAHKEYITWFNVRFVDDSIEPGMRIIFKNRKYEIEQVNPDYQRKRLTSFQCREVV